MSYVGYKVEEGTAYRSRLKDEFHNDVDPRLRAMALEQGRWQFKEFGAKLIITCCGRTKAENAAIGGAPNSAHIIKPDAWIRAIDFRARDLRKEQREEWVKNFLIWNAKVPFFVHCICHEGSGVHFHVNINFAFVMERP